MGAFLGAFKAIVGGDPLDGVSKIIDAIHPSPEQKAQAAVLLEQAKQHSAEIEAARDKSLEDYEATVQNDPAWKKAHAYFVYIVDFALALNLLIFPLWNHFTKQPIAYIPLPGDVIHLFELTFVGFAGVIHGPDIVTALKGDK